MAQKEGRKLIPTEDLLRPRTISIYLSDRQVKELGGDAKLREILHAEKVRIQNKLKKLTK